MGISFFEWCPPVPLFYFFFFFFLLGFLMVLVPHEAEKTKKISLPLILRLFLS